MRNVLSSFVFFGCSLLVATLAFAKTFDIKPILDTITGVRIGIPDNIAGRFNQSTHGLNWRSVDRNLSVDTLKFGPERTLRDLYDRLRNLDGRSVTHESFKPKRSFTLQGQDRDSSRFFIRVVEGQLGEKRGLSLVCSKCQEREFLTLGRALLAVSAEYPEQRDKELQEQRTLQLAAQRRADQLLANETRSDVEFCRTQTNYVKSVAQGIEVQFEHPANLAAGDEVTVRWTREAGENPQAPTYLVIDVPKAVRFSDGPGFLPLTAGALGLQNIRFRESRTRAFIPLHRLAVQSSALKVRPILAGPQALSWFIAVGGGCPPRVVRSGPKKEISVSLGRAELVVDDPLNDGRPIRVIGDNSRRFTLYVWKQYFEVRDARTAEKVFATRGLNPNFSPTGRFVAYEDPTASGYHIADLFVRDTIGSTGLGVIAWLRNDSAFITTSQYYTHLRIQPSLGGKAIDFRDGVRRGSDLWAGGSVRVDLDLGFVVVDELNSTVFDIYRDESITGEELKGVPNANRLWAVANKYVSKRLSERDYGNSSTGINWELAEPIKLSHPTGSETRNPILGTFYDQSKFSPAPFVVRHTELPVENRKAGSAVAPDPSGRMVLRGYRFAFKDELMPWSRRKQSAVERIHQSITPVLDSIKLRTYDFRGSEPQYSQGALDNARKRAQPLLSWIKRNIGHASMFFGNVGNFGDDNGCGDWATQVEPGRIQKAWTWSSDGKAFALIRTECPVLGSLPTNTSGLFLVRNGAKMAVLRTLLPKDAPGDANPFQRFLGEDVRAQVFVSTKNDLIIAAAGSEAAVVLDTYTGRRKSALVKLIDTELIAELRLSEKGTHLVQVNRDGQFYVYARSTGKFVMKGYHVDDEVVVTLPDARFDATYEGAQHTKIRFYGATRLFSLEQFKSKLNRPGLAAKLLNGQTIAARPDTLPEPPRVLVTKPQGELTLRTVVPVRASSARRLRRLDVLEDGMLVQSLRLDGKSAQLDVNIGQLPHSRWSTLVAVDELGLASLPISIPLKLQAKRNNTLRSVIVGVNNYAELPRLSSAVADANALSEVIRKQHSNYYAQSDITELLNGAASSERIIGAIKRAVRTAEVGDTILFSFAGHGVKSANGEFLMATSKFSLRETGKDAVSWSEISEILSRSKARVLVVLDACHSGATGELSGSTNDSAVDGLLTGNGHITVLAASKGRQLSEELPNGKGGYFTRALVSALSDKRGQTDSNKNGAIEITELYRTIKRRVVSETDGRQSPWLVRNNMIGDFAVF